MNEETLEKHAGFDLLRRDLHELLHQLAGFARKQFPRNLRGAGLSKLCFGSIAAQLRLTLGVAARYNSPLWEFPDPDYRCRAVWLLETGK